MLDLQEEQEVLDFIRRRFDGAKGTKCHSEWTDGNCYWFALILSERFDGEILYDPVAGHFVTRIKDKAFDWNGVYESGNDMIPWVLFGQEDPIWWRRVMRDCVL